MPQAHTQCQYHTQVVSTPREDSRRHEYQFRYPLHREFQRYYSNKSNDAPGEAHNAPLDEIEKRIREQQAAFSNKDAPVKVEPPSAPIELGPPSTDPPPESPSITTGEPLHAEEATTSQARIPREDAAETMTSPSPNTNEPSAAGSQVPRRDFPSYAADRRAELFKRFNETMERFMSSVAVYSQQLNTFTGTDYSGISALRSEIAAQEQQVRALHGDVDAAKRAHDAAFAAQAASQKEVVQLLERKHSWLSPDLERYMSLIRSEHVNEQAVQAAKEQLTTAERKLEDARIRLERSERKQYHEEQVWSDTIRRNSTWVTFGLMAFNILLLLASLIIIDPWRRRRLVREIRGALNEKTMASSALAAQMTLTASPAIEAAIDAATAPTAETLEEIKQDIPKTADIEVLTVDASKSEPVVLDARPAFAEPAGAAAAPTDALPTPTTNSSEPTTDLQAATAATAAAQDPLIDSSPSLTTSAIPSALDSLDPHPSAPLTIQTTSPSFPFPLWAETWSATWALYKAYWADLFSERRVALRKVDLTTTALEGAAAGAAFMGILLVLLRPR